MTSAPGFPPKHILVPADVDPTGDRALADRLVDDACALAAPLGARLTLLHVAVPIITPVGLPQDFVSNAYQALSAVAQARTHACERVLHELEERARSAGIVVRSLIVSRDGSVPEVIAEVAIEERAELVMMTTHGRRGLSRIVLGSVAERAAHLLRVPVLLIPPA